MTTPLNENAPWQLSWARQYTKNNVATEMSNTGRATNLSLEQLIDESWQAEETRAKADGVAFYNGVLGRFVSADASAEVLRLSLGHTDFRTFMGTHVCHLDQALALGQAYLANPLGVSALASTTDGYLALGRRGKLVRVHAEHLHAFGGMLESADLGNDGCYDIFRATERELCEEIGLAPEEIGELSVMGLLQDRALHQPELVFDAPLRLSKTELTDRFESGVACNEHTRIEFVADDPAAIAPFLRESDKTTPVAFGTLLVHGLHRWGQKWYDGCCGELFGATVAPTN